MAEMELWEAKEILNEYRKGKTYPRALLERAREAVRAEKQLGSIGRISK